MENKVSKPKVKAVKDGKVFTFSQKAWAIGNHEAHGFKLVGEVEDKDKVEVEKVDLGEKVEVKTVDIPNEEIMEKANVEVSKEEVKKDYPTEAEMREYLKGLADKGEIPKPPHRLLGIEKLKKMYDDNTK